MKGLTSISALRAATPGPADIGRICWACQTSRRRQGYATTASAVTVEEPTPPPPSSTDVPSGIDVSKTRQAYHMRTGIVLSRPPQITRDLTSFEKAFFLYQRRMNERVVLPFSRYFYIRKDTPAELDWKRKMKTRQTPARDIGTYNSYGGEGWNDEVLVGAPESETEHQVEALITDAEQSLAAEKREGDEERTDIKVEDPIERPQSRVTEADKTNDTKSLNRLLQRTLYLVVQGQDGYWEFPQDKLIGKEGLHRAAERVLVQSAGPNMNTWVVGNAPVGYLHARFKKPVADSDSAVEHVGDKLFFMKARIMAGQADLSENKYGLKDFRWLVKEELQEIMRPMYYSAVRNLLAER